MSASFSELLNDIGLNESEKKVYLALVKLGQGGVGDVHKNCDLPRTTIKSVLDRLFEKGFIISHLQDGVTHYWVDSLEDVKRRLHKQIGVAEDLDTFVRQIYKTNSHIPGVKVYDKKTNIRSLIGGFGDNIPRKSDLYTIDSPRNRNYLFFFTREEFYDLMKKKEKRKVITHSLIPHDNFQLIGKQSVEIQEIIIKEMPALIEFSISIWMIEGKVVFFSGKTNLIIEITNPAIYFSMKSVYNFIDSQSKEVYNNVK